MAEHTEEQLQQASGALVRQLYRKVRKLEERVNFLFAVLAMSLGADYDKLSFLCCRAELKDVLEKLAGEHAEIQAQIRTNSEAIRELSLAHTRIGVNMEEKAKDIP